MIVTGWNNGSPLKSGTGYGLKLDARDRDRAFQREWKTITIELEDFPGEIQVNISKSSFWGATCRELISAEIGRWLIRSNLAPWPNKQPPKLLLKQIQDNHFFLMKSNDRSKT